MDRKVLMASNFSCIVKLKDFSGSQASAYAAKVVIFQKWCKVYSLLQASIRKRYIKY